MDLSALGTPRGPMARVSGGYANRMYRLDTDQGSFAVKELNLADRREPYRVDDVFRLERAAFEAGIPMPEPIAADQHTLVHRWVSGEKVPERPVPAAYAHEIGEILARLHTLDVPWPDDPLRRAGDRGRKLSYPPGLLDPTQNGVGWAQGGDALDWPELADLAPGSSWGADLAQQVETFEAIAHFVDTCERPGPIVLTHRDIQPWNLLSRDGHPVLLDWELAGRLDLSGELGSTALSLAKGPGLDDLRPDIFHAVLDGYVTAGGKLPPWGPSWFVFLIGGWLSFTRWNILRCLSGTEATTGPDLALAQESAANGIRGLPLLFARLPELLDRLQR